MTSIKVKLRISTIPGRAGTIYYQISRRTSTRQLSTRIKIAPEAWLPQMQQIAPEVCRTPEGRLLQYRIESDVAQLRRIVRELDALGRDYGPNDIILRFRTPEVHTLFLEEMQQQVEELLRSNRQGTARNYLRTMNSFRTFLGGRDIPFPAVTEMLVEDYNRFLLRRGVVRNTVSFYMRILRAVYNKAVDRYHFDQIHPFRHVYTGIDRTRKRAIDERLIARLWQLDLSDTPALGLARDLFVFSYSTRGMAFVDMAFLQAKNIRAGEIVYMRRKTGQRLCVKIEPCMREIIKRQAAKAYTPYLFPILTTTEPGRAFSQYQIALNRYNQLLKRLARLLKLDQSLTSYTARHSWATAARKHNVPLAVISAGMGHSSERTTQIYLTMLENSVIDSANRKITAFLNRKVSTQETI